MTFKMRKRLGNESVQDIVEKAAQSHKAHPGITVRDPWPPSERKFTTMPNSQKPSVAAKAKRAYTIAQEALEEIVRRKKVSSRWRMDPTCKCPACLAARALEEIQDEMSTLSE